MFKRYIATRLFTTLVSCFAASAVAQQLTPAEQNMIEAVKARSADALKLLEKSVNINSGTMNHDGVREVGKIFRAELDALGFTTNWVEMPKEMSRAGHLVATKRGTSKGKRLLLIGHLDTVFEKDSPVTAWKPDGRRVYGQGVSDMKGGNVIIIEALRAMKVAGTLDAANISVIFTGDEERVGEPIDIARADMVSLAKQSDIALAFEGMIRDVNGNEFASIARRASGSWTPNVSGRQGHSSGVFGPLAGYGAAYEMARILNAFREQLQEPNFTYNVGIVLAGTEVNYDDALSKGSAAGKANIIPPLAVVKGDMRYLTKAQGEHVRARMVEIVGQNLRGTSATITFKESYPPMSPTEGNLAVFKQYAKASEDAGLGKLELTAPSTRGAGDIQFVAPLVDCLDGLGASGGGSHSPNEYLNPESIERNAIRAAILMSRLTR